MIDEGYVRPTPSKHKDTKRWCRGKEGVEHEWVARPSRWWMKGISEIDVCKICGRRNRNSYRRIG